MWITVLLYKRYVTKALDILTSVERLLCECHPIVCLHDIDSALEMIASDFSAIRRSHPNCLNL